MSLLTIAILDGKTGTVKATLQTSNAIINIIDKYGLFSQDTVSGWVSFAYQDPGTL
jgi:hypothetical protein